MLTKTITYTDYDGNTRTEDFYFNLSKSELAEMEMTTVGSLTTALTKMVKANDVSDLVKAFKSIILKAYGEKSPDGRRLVKSEELAVAFTQTPAYDSLFMELFTDTDKALNFVYAIIPQDMAKAAAEHANQPVLAPLA